MPNVMGIFSNFDIFFNAHNQIWSCHVTQDVNFEIFYFVLILHLIFRIVTKFLVKKLATSEVISHKPHGVVKTTHPPPPPPVLLGSKNFNFLLSKHK